MKSFRDALENYQLDPKYDYLYRRRSISGRLVKSAFELYCRLFFRVYCPLKIEGRDRLPASPYILCGNHNSHMDSALLMLAAGTGFHGFAMTAAKDYFFNNASRRFFLNLFMNLIPIERKFSHESFVEYLAATRAFLDVGDRNLIIYPEGTRSLDGKMGRFKRGPAVVAVELGIPIVPACIEGSHRCWPKGKGFIRPGGVKVTIGEPVYPDSAAVAASADSPSAPFDEYRRLIAEVETRVGELCGNQVPDPVDCVAG